MRRVDQRPVQRKAILVIRGIVCLGRKVFNCELRHKLPRAYGIPVIIPKWPRRLEEQILQSVPPYILHRNSLK